MRDEKTIEITAEGRDKGKKFIITEPSAWDAEVFASDIYREMAKSGITPSDEIVEMGMAGLKHAGLTYLELIDRDVSINLKTFALSHVKNWSPNGGVHFDYKTDVEEIQTIRTLIDEFFDLTFDFLIVGNQ